MKRRLVWLAALVAVTLSASTDEMAEKIRLQNQNVVKAAAEALSKELPKRVDPYTRLIAIDADGERLVYTFEVNAGPKSDEELKRRKASRTRVVTAGLCQSADRFLKSGITIVYRYVSAATKKQLFDVVVTEKECPFLDD